MNSRIIGTGQYLPENIVTNEKLSETVDTSHDWIVERTGICQRHIADDDATTSGLAYHAVMAALKDANVDAQDIDLIILATTTPDHTYPSTATLLQEMIGNNHAASFDISAACSGFIYALGIADNFIKAGSAKKAIVVGSELYSRVLDWGDRTTCVLFGDGAAAVVLEATEEEGIISTHLHADGSYKDLLSVKKSVISGPDVYPYVQMKGNEVFRHAVTKLHEIVEETLTAANLTGDDIDWLIPHQANLRIMTATAKRAGMPREKMVVTVDKHANTSAASIPLALDVARKDGRVKKGDLVLMEAFGGGFTWGSALVRM